MQSNSSARLIVKADQAAVIAACEYVVQGTSQVNDRKMTTLKWVTNRNSRSASWLAVRGVKGSIFGLCRCRIDIDRLDLSSVTKGVVHGVRIFSHISGHRVKDYRMIHNEVMGGVLSIAEDVQKSVLVMQV